MSRLPVSPVSPVSPASHPLLGKNRLCGGCRTKGGSNGTILSALVPVGVEGGTPLGEGGAPKNSEL